MRIDVAGHAATVQALHPDSHSALDPEAREVLAFWFGPPDSPTFGTTRAIWFKKDPAFDAQVRDRFMRTHAAVAGGQRLAWRASAGGSLALVVVLDQFSRNMFRDTPRAFAFDAQALAIARDAVDAGVDVGLLPVERGFLYLPFEHSEDLAQQQRSVELFSQLAPYPGMAEAIDYARRHYDIIARFGRFPHRNRVLGRASTAEELEFLSQPGSAF